LRTRLLKITFLIISFSQFSWGNCFVLSDSIKIVSAKKVENFKFRDMEGMQYVSGQNIQVFIFLDIECPISQRYTSYLQELSAKFQQSNVSFFGIFPTANVHQDDLKVFGGKYNFTIPFVIDKFHHITKLLDATATPEVFVLGKNQEILYQGMIDNKYYDLGKSISQASEFYLVNALEAILKNQKPQIPYIQAIGCDIERIQ
jgi:peroxiredoxin